MIVITAIIIIIAYLIVITITIKITTAIIIVSSIDIITNLLGHYQVKYLRVRHFIRQTFLNFANRSSVVSFNNYFLIIINYLKFIKPIIIDLFLQYYLHIINSLIEKHYLS